MLSELGDFTTHTIPTVYNEDELEKRGTGYEKSVTPSVLPEFYSIESALQNIYVYRSEFGDLFNSLMVGSISSSYLVN